LTDQLLIPAREFARLIGQDHATVRHWCADEEKRRHLEARKTRDGNSWVIPRRKLGEYEPKFRVAGELAELLSWVRARRVARDYYGRQLAEARTAVVEASRDVVEQDGDAETVKLLRKAIFKYVKAAALEPVVQEIESEAGRAIAAADCLQEDDIETG
jgi:predicted transcriptional regulator